MKARQVLAAICRVLVGLLFIFSGFIKADDPMGFGYKLEEYFTVFGTTFLNPIAVYLSMLICIFEIFLGVLLLLGIWRRFTAWLLLLMILFFTFLTFYSAYFNKVTDCGCFGDAIHLTPWQSFTKDLILLVLILVIFVNQKYIVPLFPPRTGRNVAWVLLLLFTGFTVYAYMFLPPIDFRPYKIGNDIQSLMHAPPGAPTDSFVMTFVYEKNGQRKEFSMDELDQIDSTWQFKERNDVKVREGYKPPIHDFAIYNAAGTEITDSFLGDAGAKLMIVQYDLEKSNTGAQDKLNQLVEALKAEGKVKLWPVTASSKALMKYYSDKYHPAYDFYQMDGTVLKTIIRSNPGLVLYKGNTVVGKWPSTALPSKEDIDSKLK